jgi:acetyl esterase
LKSVVVFLIGLLGVVGSAYSQSSFHYPPTMPGAKVEVCRNTDGVDLNMYIFQPDDFSPVKSYPAIIFFFGGGWNAGSPEQFLKQSKYLASRGMFALVADYRVASRNETKVVDCVRDAKAAVRWTRINAKRLGIDKQRIVASGGSAGGHLAATTGLVPELEHADQNLTISSVPNALVLFNPATVLAPYGEIKMDEKRLGALRKRIAAENESVSPIHHVANGNPPTLIFHGDADTTVPIDTALAFTEAMNDAGNDCTLMQYEGEKHGFFNYGRGDGTNYINTVSVMDKFLIKLGYLSGNPTIR